MYSSYLLKHYIFIDSTRLGKCLIIVKLSHLQGCGAKCETFSPYNEKTLCQKLASIILNTATTFFIKCIYMDMH